MMYIGVTLHRNHAFLSVLFLLLAFSSGATEATVSSPDYLVESWDTDSGLPHSTVTSIAQTPDGYLWVGTLHGGLARFDGKRFVNFHPGNTPELKSIEIHKLLVDARGTLWIGNVEGGLISYRAGKFRFEYLNNQTPRSWVERILSDEAGQLEFSTRPGLVFRCLMGPATNRWQTIELPNANTEAMLCEDAEKVLWYRAANGGLCQRQGTNTLRMTNPSGLRNPQINALVKDAGGRIWAGTEKEIAVWDGNAFVTMTPTNGEPEVAVRSLLPCADGSFWVLTPDRLRKCLDRTWTVEAVGWTNGDLGKISGTNFMAGLNNLFVDSHGGLWFAHEKMGLGHVAAGGRISWVRAPQFSLKSGVQCWLEDYEGNIWLGLADGGLVRLRPRIFNVVWPASGVDSESARSVCEDEQGVMWFGTAKKQVLRWQDEAFTILNPPGQPPSFNEVKVLPAGDGRLWIGTVQGGLLEFQNGKFQQPFPARAIGTVARCLLRDRAGALWIGSEFGLFRWDHGVLKTFSAPDGFLPAYVLSIAEDKAGGIWLGTALGGLRHYQDGKFDTFRPQDSLTDEATLEAAAVADPLSEHGRGALSGGERFWALYCDEDNVLWIGTLGGGLLRFKDGQFQRFTVAEGLPSEHVSQILEDRHGQLWLGTSAGIARVSKRELNDFAAVAKNLPNVVTYGKTDGLPALECSGGSQPACWQSHDGRLWFTTIKGAVWVDPNNLPANKIPPPVFVEDVFVDGKDVTANGESPARPGALAPPELRVSAGRHYFEFKFTALSLTSPDKVRFRWRLAGLEKDWVEGGDRRTVSYSFIPPGSYQFQVQACNNDGVWNETGAAVKLIVPPYFWQTWWFKILVAVFIFLVLGGIYSVRVARLQALERLRLRIARDLHDEVGANLASISLISQLMETTPSTADATQVRGLAVQTIDTLRDIVWFIDPLHDNLSDLVTRLQQTAKVMLTGVSYTFESPSDFRSANLPLTFRRNVPPVFKETLHNLLKHSRATAVEITVRRVENNFQFRIHDNGVGFVETGRSLGNGLKNMRRRAAEIGGRLEIASGTGAGTTVTLTAPITQTRDWWKSKSGLNSS